MSFKAKSVEECWRIARKTAMAYQRAMNHAGKKRQSPRWATCKAARDAADRIAAKIKYGRRHK